MSCEPNSAEVARIAEAIRRFFDLQCIGPVTGFKPEELAYVCLAAMPAQACQWLPIESAPLNEFVWLYCPEDKSRWMAAWQSGQWHGVDELGLTRDGHSMGDKRYLTGWFVSHWQPLPKPPMSEG